jgi:hypothetical protein
MEVILHVYKLHTLSVMSYNNKKNIKTKLDSKLAMKHKEYS